MHTSDSDDQATSPIDALAADPTGRRKLLKQIAAGGAGAALVWAAPTITRTDRASAAASGTGGDPGPSCTYPGFSERFEWTPGSGDYVVYGTGFYANYPSSTLEHYAQGFTVATPGYPANVDLMINGAVWGFTAPEFTGIRMIGLGGSYGDGSDGRPDESRQVGAASITLNLPAGEYTLAFNWGTPDGPWFTPRTSIVSLTGATFVSPVSTSTNVGPGVPGVFNSFEQNITSLGGPVTIKFSDSVAQADGMGFTNVRVYCAGGTPAAYPSAPPPP